VEHHNADIAIQTTLFTQITLSERR